MKWKAGIIGIALASLGCNAQAFTSAYTHMAIAGNCFSSQWDVNTNLLSLTADYKWSGTVTILNASGAFKFAANRSWAINWGTNLTLLHVPARGVGSLAPNGNDITFSGLPTGNYLVSFYEQTATFDLLPVVSAPNPTAIQLIGSFNGDGATSAGTMTNTSGSTWTTTVALDTGADFRFKLSAASGTNHWGALAATDITGLPFSGGNPCGSASYRLAGVVGGAFVFTYHFQSNVFSIAQIATNAFTLDTVTARGNFVAGNPPDYNLEKISSTLWRSDFTVTNAASFTLSFIGRNSVGGIGRYWGATNAAARPLPATGFMLASVTSNSITNATFTAVPGNYRLTLDANSGEFSVQQRYTAASGINYLQNPSFENLSFGVPANWGTYHATSGEQADFGAHSGARCGVLMAKSIPTDWDLGNFDQSTAPLIGLSGQTFRVSAAFRTKGAFTATTIRIIVEWWHGTNLVDEDSAEIVGLNEKWQTHALETPVPGSNVFAKILFKYDGDPGTGYLLVDDAEARIAAARFQDFNGWGNIPQFTNISPDWATTSGKTMINAGDNAPTGGVVISKYVEGSGNNKAIEIFNGTGAATDLLAGQYVLQQYNNGSPTASVSIALAGNLPAGETLVVTRPAIPTNAYPPVPELLATGTLRLPTNALTFNGDDVVVLRKGGPGGPIVDRVGQVGTNYAGSFWSRYATDHTLHRKPQILWGNTNSLTNVFSLADWIVLPKDDFSDLGTHFFTLNDPNAPFVPTGYSLLLNTNSVLMTPELDGGIGDISFWARAQGGAAGAITIAVETATSQTSTNWATAEILTIPLTTTNFALFTTYATQALHTVMRVRHVGDGTTNRLRIDDVSVGPAFAIKRTETFAAWTAFLGAPLGSYTIAEWAIQNAKIGTNRPYGNLCAELYPDAGSVTSPRFEAGVGTVKFLLAHHPQEVGEIRAQVLTSTNDWATWVTNATIGLLPNGTNAVSTNCSVAIFLPVPSAVRITAFGSPHPFVIDNIDVAIPSISRKLTFNDFSVNSDYGTYSKEGWSVTETAITTYPVYSGNSGKLRNASITSPYIDSIGPISFYYLTSTNSGDDTARLTVEISSDGNAWTVLQSNLAPSPAVQLYSFYNTNTTYHFVRIRQTTKDKRIFIDEISIGKPAPAPSCAIAAGLSPLSPTPDEGFYVVADVIPKNGADIVAVTGAYRIASGAWNNLAMTAVEFGSYRSELLPPRPAGTRISYRASVIYAGIGAAPGSTSYTSNTAYSTTNSIFVSSVPRGTVWINEIFYSAFTNEYDFWEDKLIEDHEFIELCGVAGTSITNWKVQLLLLSASDIQKNGGTNVYATYTIPAGTILSNTANGYGFYVFGDQPLTSNNPVNQILTTLVPTNVNPLSVGDHDHIRDRSGIIRLLDNFGNVVYSLSYGAYDSSSDRIPASQAPTDNTTSLSLSGTGSAYDDFSWNNTNSLTIGAPNGSQTLVPDSGLPFMGVWHTPAAIAQTALQGTFGQFQPIQAAQSDPLYIHYAYTNAAFAYGTIGGIVHHRKQGAAGWSTAAKQLDFPGNNDTNGTGYAYLRMGPIPAYTYDRLDVLEYVVEAIPPGGSGLATAYLGSDGDDSSRAYATLAEAKLYPFRYTFPIADLIFITKFTVSNRVVRLETDGNDTLDPIVRFNVRSTTNLLTPTSAWSNLNIQSLTRTNEQNYFTVTNPTAVQRFIAVQPLWP